MGRVGSQKQSKCNPGSHRSFVCCGPIWGQINPNYGWFNIMTQISAIKHEEMNLHPTNGCIISAISAMKKVWMQRCWKFESWCPTIVVGFGLKVPPPWWWLTNPPCEGKVQTTRDVNGFSNRRGGNQSWGVKFWRMFFLFFFGRWNNELVLVCFCFILIP